MPININEFVRGAGAEPTPRAVYPVHMCCWEMLHELNMAKSPSFITHTHLDHLVSAMRELYPSSPGQIFRGMLSPLLLTPYATMHIVQ